jgi:hypothetical protein
MRRLVKPDVKTPPKAAATTLEVKTRRLRKISGTKTLMTMTDIIPKFGKFLYPYKKIYNIYFFIVILS